MKTNSHVLVSDILEKSEKKSGKQNMPKNCNSVTASKGVGLTGWLLLLLFLFLSAHPLYAIPAYPRPIKFTQPNGDTLTIVMKGDEFMKFAMTQDGYTLMCDDQGFFRYARRNVNGDMEPSEYIARSVNNRSVRDRSFLQNVQRGLFYSETQLDMLSQIREMQVKESISQKAFPTTGERKLICILMAFNDRAFIRSQQEFYNLFNQTNYNFQNANGSVRDYFSEVSYRQLDLSVDVVGPFTASQNMAYYGANASNGNDIRPGELVREACTLAYQSGVNFSDYDNDRDGTVDGVYVIYAGYSEAAGASPNTIWPHAYYINMQLGGVKIQSYSCSSELRGNSGSDITRIGVICHEFGHTLGAMDYYDTNYKTGGQYEGTGEWDLQASGSWNDGGRTPPHPNPRTKIYTYKWATVTELNTPQIVQIPPSYNDKTAFYRINTATSGEYFLIENRQMRGFDAYLPGHGMMIYRCHSAIGNSESLNAINSTHPQRFYPVSANAPNRIPTSDARSYGNIDANSCPWPGTFVKTQFTDASIPGMQSWSGVNTEMPITGITENNTSGVISFQFMGGSGYVINTLASDGGTISPSGYVYVDTGDSQTFTFQPNEGYQIEYVYIDNVSNPKAASDGSYTFSNITGNHTIQVYFGCPAISLPVMEDFESSPPFPPDCWNNVSESGSTWGVASWGVDPVCFPHSGNRMVYFNCPNFGNGNTGLLITPRITINNHHSTLTFWMYRDNWGFEGGMMDKVNVYLSPTKSISGLTPVYSLYRCRIYPPAKNSDGWYQYAVNLATASMDYAYIIFEGVSNHGNNIYIDDITIEQKPDYPAPVNLEVTYNSNCEAVLTWNLPAESGASSEVVKSSVAPLNLKITASVDEIERDETDEKHTLRTDASSEIQMNHPFVKKLRSVSPDIDKTTSPERDIEREETGLRQILHRNSPSEKRMNQPNVRKTRSFSFDESIFESTEQDDIDRISFKQSSASPIVRLSEETDTKNAAWMTWIPNVPTSNVSLTYSFEVGFFQRFATEDLTDYAGQYLTKIRYRPNSSSSSPTDWYNSPIIQVYVGGSYNGTSFTGGTLVAEVIAVDYSENSDNFVELPTPVFIDGMQEIWFGVIYDVVAGYPMKTIPNGGADYIYGKTDLIFYNNTWTTTYDAYTSHPRYGWYLAAYTRNPLPDETCDIIVEMEDDYGDGWNNGYISFIDQNGIEWDRITMNWDLLSGGKTPITVTLPRDVEINCHWTPGSYSEEVGFVIKHSNGTIIHTCNIGNFDKQPAGVFKTFTNNACVSRYYNVYRDEVLIASNVTTAYYTDVSADASVGHTWSVRTVGTESESGSAIVTKSSCYDGLECKSAANLEVNYNSDCEAKLTWEAPAGTNGTGDNATVIYGTHDYILYKTTVGKPEGNHLPFASSFGLYTAMEIVNGNIYVCFSLDDYYGFGVLDPETGELDIINLAEIPHIASMAWNPVNNTLYATGATGSSTYNNSPFGIIDRSTGVFTQLGTVPSICFIAIDNDGVCYGLNIDKQFGTINLTNGAFTRISTYPDDLGNYYQDLAFDLKSGELYHAAKLDISGLPSFWRKIDKNTGDVTPLENFYKSVASFVIISGTDVAYNLYRDGTPVASDITSTSYTDAGFDVTAEHTWTVTVVCKDGESNPVSVTQSACNQTHTITASAEDNGNISPAGDVDVMNGADQTFIFTPDEGYRIEYVLVNDENDPVAAAFGTYTFENVTANHTIHVTFAVNTHFVMAIAERNGSITPPGEVIVQPGADQTFTFTPDLNYEVDELLVDGVNMPDAIVVGSYTFVNVTENHTIIVSFKEGEIIPVTDITSVPAAVAKGTPLSLTGTVVPTEATNHTIIWTVADEGTTGATVTNGNTFNAPTTGTAIILATITNGEAIGTDYKQEFHITVGDLPVITIDDLPEVTVGTEYDLTLTALSGTSITWSIESGSLPEGLNFSVSDGVTKITGVPTTAGKFDFTLVATNIAGSVTKEVSIVIIAASTPPVITTESLPNGTVDVAYDQVLSATGDTPIVWSVENGSLPDGLNFSVSGDITKITGTPTTAGKFDFTLRATNNGGSVTKALSIVVIAPPVITTESLPDVTVGTAYSQTLTATGDTPIAWALESGNLPNGLDLSGNTILGTPTVAGTFNFTIKATNSGGSDTKALSIVVNVLPTITTASLPNGTVGVAYSQTLAATGTLPIAWLVENGSLPDGLNLSGNTISGTPTAAGTSNFTVKATNNFGNIDKPLSIVIGKGTGATLSAPSLASKTDNSITIQAVATPANGQTVEYACTTAGTAPTTADDWKTALTFTGLNPNTAYNIFARAVENANYFAGAASTSLSVTTDKSAGATVSAPTLASKTANSITINAVTAPANGQTVEYACATANTAPTVAGDWKTALVFTGLNANTAYFIFARTTENANYFAGAASASLSVTTDRLTGSGELPSVNPLKAWTRNGLLHVTGITVGETLSVFTVTGILVYQNIESSDEADIPLEVQGVYIVRQGNSVIKVVFKN